jgi:putative membrane protein
VVKHRALHLPAAWVTILVPIASYAQGTAHRTNWDWYGPWHMMHGVGWGFWWIFPILMMAFMVGACILMWRFVMGRGHSYRDDTKSAVRILNERLARGEITNEEYQEKRTVLTRRE